MRLLLFCLITSFAGYGQDQWKNVYSRSAWDARDKWQRADELIKFLNLDRESHVADIGCHEGYMTFKLAKEVTNGNVYAVDVDQSKLDKLKKHIEDNGLNNIHVIKGDYDNPKLPPDKLDAVLILDTYHEMDDHDKILQHVKTSLKRGGKLVICEPIAEERRKLPRTDQEKRHELGMKYAIEDLQRAGFKISYQKDPFIDRTKEKGDKMWVLVGEKN